jgi:NADH dehydrogenase (ubiquinone) 1 alpha subcomplex subunit 6
MINLLIYKGREELETVLLNHKQRHHLVTGYLNNPALDVMKRKSTLSPFLEEFYKGN